MKHPIARGLMARGMLAAGVVAGVCGVATAGELRDTPRTGADTRAWLALQAGGAAATRAPQSMPGEVADKVYERYLKSFERPIPEEFDRERFVSGSSGN